MARVNQEAAAKYGVVAIGQGTKIGVLHLNRLKEFIEQKGLKINVDKTFFLDQVKKAFQYQEEQHPRGKVVLIM